MHANAHVTNTSGLLTFNKCLQCIAFSMVQHMAMINNQSNNYRFADES